MFPQSAMDKIELLMNDAVHYFVTSCLPLFHSIEIPEQAAVERETDNTGDGSRYNYCIVTAEIGIHRCRQYPQLQDDNQDNNTENAINNRGLLLA